MRVRPSGPDWQNIPVRRRRSEELFRQTNTDSTIRSVILPAGNGAAGQLGQAYLPHLQLLGCPAVKETSAGPISPDKQKYQENLAGSQPAKHRLHGIMECNPTPIVVLTQQLLYPHNKYLTNGKRSFNIIQTIIDRFIVAASQEKISTRAAAPRAQRGTPCVYKPVYNN